MTLSNFDWTDKTSLKWFIMLPTGHEGPYDLKRIEQLCIQGILSQEVKIWAEGLDQQVTVRVAIKQSEFVPIEIPEPEPEPEPEIEPETNEAASELPPEVLPPLPEEDIPPLPLDFSSSEDVVEPIQNVSVKAPKGRFSYYFFGASLIGGLLCFFISQWVKSNENFSIRRQTKMSIELHKRIESEIFFKKWNQKIFFKEYVPADLSHIWLVTGSMQKCDIEADFQSIQGKLLSAKDEAVSFRSEGKLSNHVVQFSTFDFRSGNKVIPGMYELDVKASGCEWDSFSAKLANIFRPVEKEYQARVKVILFPEGSTKFSKVLAALIEKKSAQELKIQNREEMFWQDLQQKFQTLLAISLQIEQHLLDLTGKGPRRFRQNLLSGVEIYTKNFGHFLTNFVVSNETYFKQLDGLSGRSTKRNYELMVTLTSKKIGNESMKIIEELQKLKKPTSSKLNSFQKRLKKTFGDLKKDINQKIIQISEDRSS